MGSRSELRINGKPRFYSKRIPVLPYAMLSFGIAVGPADFCKNLKKEDLLIFRRKTGPVFMFLKLRRIGLGTDFSGSSFIPSSYRTKAKTRRVSGRLQFPPPRRVLFDRTSEYPQFLLQGCGTFRTSPFRASR